MTANTICSDTAIPLTVSGEMNIWYWQYSAPASAVISALTSVILSFSAVTLTPAAAAASSSSEIASMGVAAHGVVDPAPDQKADDPDPERDQVPGNLVVELQRQQLA